MTLMEDRRHHGELAHFRSRPIGVLAAQHGGERAMNGQFTVVIGAYREDRSGL
ncbi:hypothetical protein [Parafrankia sp. BMG5.11]|uniref:hypothetical protein n=1 Tax=Parafrankia sp. BMG5.11 TaxID=222540 RepID=UPI0014052C5E|nr:hypothetical protein [Parafrankia sp. BMG5.11]